MRDKKNEMLTGEEKKKARKFGRSGGGVSRRRGEGCPGGGVSGGGVSGVGWSKTTTTPPTPTTNTTQHTKMDWPKMDWPQLASQLSWSKWIGQSRPLPPEGWEPRRVGCPKICAFFPLSRRKIRSFLPSLGVFSVEFWWCLKAPGPFKCARLEFSGCHVKLRRAPKPPRFHTTADTHFRHSRHTQHNHTVRLCVGVFVDSCGSCGVVWLWVWDHLAPDPPSAGPPKISRFVSPLPSPVSLFCLSLEVFSWFFWWCL